MPKSVNIGKLRERLTFQYDVMVADGQGGFIPVDGSDPDVYVTWGSVKETRGDREMRTGQIAFNVAYEIIARYRNGDTSEPLNKYRIVYKGTDLTIHTILTNDESTVKILAYSTGL